MGACRCQEPATRVPRWPLSGEGGHQHKDLLGHTSLALVSSVYVHPLEESQRIAAAGLDKLLLGEDEG